MDEPADFLLEDPDPEPEPEPEPPPPDLLPFESEAKPFEPVATFEPVALGTVVFVGDHSLTGTIRDGSANEINAAPTLSPAPKASVANTRFIYPSIFPKTK